MNRRNSLTTLAAAALSVAIPSSAASSGIQLHVDLNVDPAKEKDLLKNFATIFQPTIKKQPGFVDVKLMKLRTVAKGTGPANTNYRLLLSFQTEDQRLKWAASDDHQKAWPTIDKNLRGDKLSAVLFDLV
jgi:heme-degrading monooxygenase HmoA